MSYIVRKSIDGGNLEVIGRLCELRDIEVCIGGKWVKADRATLSAFFGNKLNPSKSSLSMRRTGTHQSVAMTLSDDKVTFAYDSDYEKASDKNGFTIFGLLLSDTGQPTDAYLQAATTLYAENNGLQFTIQPDYLGTDGVWCIGGLDIVVESNSQSEMVGNTAV